MRLAGKIACFTAMMFFIVLFAYHAWLLGKRLNYQVGYESMVRETVREMVKKESLRGGE